MKRWRDSTEWNCSMKMVFSPAKRFLHLQPDKYHSLTKNQEEEPAYSVERIEKQGLRFCQTVRQTLTRAEDYLAFLKLFHCYSNGEIDDKKGCEKITKEQLEEGVVSLIRKHSDLIGEFKPFLNHCENFHEIEQEKAERRFKRQKLDEGKKGRDQEKEDGDSVKYNSPSYQLFPKDHLLAATTTGRIKPKSGVLNDYCAAKPPKIERGNYERQHNSESLQNLWEEEKCEIDVLLEWVKSAMTCQEELEGGTPLNEIIGLKGIQFKRCVERMYGDHAPEIFALVEENHKVAVPVVIARLTQKEEELKKLNEEFGKL